MKNMIAVIDYGMGNLHSVRKALEVVGAKAKVTSRPEDLRRAEKIVFPGVGAFGEAMKELERRHLVEPIRDAIGEGKYFLGLCLGLQLLFEKSEESPGVKGLCVLKGDVKRFGFTMKSSKENLKVPHMGWNDIKMKNKKAKSKILSGISDGSYMYFVHSYYVRPKDKDITSTTTDYGIGFVSGIQKDNIYAFQFHPEKSQKAGLKILENFIRLH